MNERLLIYTLVNRNIGQEILLCTNLLNQNDKIVKYYYLDKRAQPSHAEAHVQCMSLKHIYHLYPFLCGTQHFPLLLNHVQVDILGVYFFFTF